MIHSTDNIKDGDGKLFNWNSSEDGKRDWSLFLMKLKSLMGERRWCMDEAATAAQLPGEPPEEPPAGSNYSVRAAYQGRLGKWRSGNQDVEVAFCYAISKTCEAFDMGCMASYQIQQALAKPAATEAADWTAVKQFKAVMAMLKANYARSTDADVAALRLRLSQLNDSGPEGFHGFQREFVQVLTQLRATKEDAVSDRELVQWVKAAIRNSFVNSTLLLKWYVETDDITHEQILARVTRLLVELANHDEDPYNQASGVKGPVAANVAESRGQWTVEPRQQRTSDRRKRLDRCTLCWGEGHWWRDCPNGVCEVCGTVIGRLDQTCPKWREHDPSLRFEGDIEPWNRGREGPSDESGADTGADRDGSTSQASASSSHDAAKANRAARGWKQGRRN
jgi:hypothetical protein